MNSFVKYKKALKQGADYVAFGSVFKSKTKSKKANYPDNIVVIKKKIKLPFTLIGGINHNNILSLKDLKPNNVAVIGSIWDYEENPVFSANLFKKILGKVI
jgi:thiamine-phosphate pyrophosphorylase